MNINKEAPIPVDISVQDVNSGMRPSEAGKKFEEQWPGVLKVANERGHFFGTAAVVLAPDEIEAYFHDKPNHLVVEVKAFETTFGAPRVLVLWTKTMTDEELSRYDRIQRKVDELLRQEDEEREAKVREAEEKAKADQVKRAKAAQDELSELKRLAAIGRKASRKDALATQVRAQADLIARLVAVASENGDPRIQQLAAEALSLTEGE